MTHQPKSPGMRVDTASSIALLLLLFCLALYLKSNARRRPPGPKPLPLIGNLLDFPLHYAWLTYDKWKEQYGDVIHMEILGTPIVVLNSHQACTDLLDKRSVKYSSRPHSVMTHELMGWESMFALMPYSSRWRKHRRLFHEYFNETVSNIHHPIQLQATHTLLQRLYNDQERLFDHLRALFGESMTELMYGIKVKSPNDAVLKQMEAAAQSLARATVPGQFLVDMFPLLKYIPAWLPGSAFKRQAAEWNSLGQHMRTAPFVFVKNNMDEGIARPSVVASMISKCDEEEFRNTRDQQESLEQTIKSCAATAYLAGADTTLSSLEAFFLAMANHPEVQKTAQMELDSMIGDSRLPVFEDVKDLPFIEAIIKELLRWHNTAPLGLAHCLDEDDEYNGYILRKGTIILPNTWSILHDPGVYSDPLAFNPWRWTLKTSDGMRLNDALPDPNIAAFGFGRRACPGRHFATNSLFIAIASVLACFDIRPLDSKRRPADRIEELFTSGLISRPQPFNVSITPRSERLARMLRDMDQ